MKKVKVSWDEVTEEIVEDEVRYFANVYNNGEGGVIIDHDSRYCNEVLATINGTFTYNYVGTIPVNKTEKIKKEIVKRKTLGLLLPSEGCDPISCIYVCKECFYNYGFLTKDKYKNLKIEEIGNE